MRRAPRVAGLGAAGGRDRRLSEGRRGGAGHGARARPRGGGRRRAGRQRPGAGRRRRSARGCAGRRRPDPGGARLRPRRRLPAHQPRPLRADPGGRADRLGVPARHRARAVALPGPQPADRRAGRRRGGGRGEGAKRCPDHRRPRARPGARRAGGAGLAGVQRGGRHQRAAQGRRGTDRERRGSQRLARSRDSGLRSARTAIRCWPRCATSRPIRTSCRLGCGCSPAELSAALARLELGGEICRDGHGRWMPGSAARAR